MASQVLAGLNSSGCSTWTDFLPGAHRACPAATVLPGSSSLPGPEGLFPCRGLLWTDRHAHVPGYPGDPQGHFHLSSDPQGF